MMPRSNLGGYGGPLQHKCVATSQLKHKDTDIGEDDAPSDDGNTGRASRRIAKGDQTAHFDFLRSRRNVVWMLHDLRNQIVVVGLGDLAPVELAKLRFHALGKVVHQNL